MKNLVAFGKEVVTVVKEHAAVSVAIIVVGFTLGVLNSCFGL